MNLPPVKADCPVCGQTLEVPVTATIQGESTTPGHALVTLEIDADWLEQHKASHG